MQLLDAPVRWTFVLIVAGVAVVVGGLGNVVIGGVLLVIDVGFAIGAVVQRVVWSRSAPNAT